MLSARAANTVELARRHTFAPRRCTRPSIESDRAVEVASTTSDISASIGRRTRQKSEVRDEYERIWSLLGNRTIEELIDLPLMTDPDIARNAGRADRSACRRHMFTTRICFHSSSVGWSTSASSMATAMVRALPMYCLAIVSRAALSATTRPDFDSGSSAMSWSKSVA